MSSADWTSISNGSGAFTIIADGTAPSPPDVMQITAGGQMFQNITAGPFQDSRISAWFNQSGTSTNPAYLVLRSMDDTTFLSAPATLFVVQFNPETATDVQARVTAVVNGVGTIIVDAHNLPSVNGNPSGSWQQYQFSVFDSGTDMLLRFSQWNGSVFVPLVDCAAPIATFPTLDAPGSCRFGALFQSSTIEIDDVNYYSLT